MSSLGHIIQEGLVSSVKECFTVTLNEAQLSDNEQVQASVPQNCLICTVGFAGKLEGNVIIRIVDEFACKIVGQMLGMEFPEVSSDVIDGFSEVGNLVAGTFKNRMSVAGHSFDITVPTTMSGKNIGISFPKDTHRLVRHFDGANFNFDVFVDYKIHEVKGTPSAEKSGARESAFGKLKNALNRIK